MILPKANIWKQRHISFLHQSMIKVKNNMLMITTSFFEHTSTYILRKTQPNFWTVKYIFLHSALWSPFLLFRFKFLSQTLKYDINTKNVFVREQNVGWHLILQGSLCSSIELHSIRNYGWLQIRRNRSTCTYFIFQIQI